jgi:hypothetical protein
MGKYLICGHPDGIFRSSDMGKTWNIVHSEPWIIFHSGVAKKYLKYLFPAIHCTLWREVLDAENELSFFESEEVVDNFY